VKEKTMTKVRTCGIFACLSALVFAVACGEDDKAPGDDTSSKGGKNSGGASTAGTSSEGGKSSAPGGSDGSGGTTNSAVGGSTNGATGGTTGGTTEPSCNIYDASRSVETIPVDSEGNLKPSSGSEFTLTSDKTWKLNGKVFVPSGVTLKIDPCTLIVGTPKPNAGSLFVMRGAKLVAEGTAARPIVFSSMNNKFDAAAPWGGLVLLGKAPIGAASSDPGTPERLFEGLTDPRVTYGGSVSDDNSGSLSYVRIEYGGDVIVSTKEINGLTLAGVGSGTSIHHVMVKRTLDDCFEWFGGTVNAHHLICENPGDDMFDTDERYRGSLQFLFGRLTTYGTSTDPNGFEWDGNQVNTTVSERSIPKAANATLCGINKTGMPAASYGAVLRRGLQTGTTLQNVILTGFDDGFDLRDNVGTNASPTISWTNSLFFGQLGNAFAADSETDDDSGFDELDWIEDAVAKNGTDKPAGFDCHANPPAPFPSTTVTGGDTTPNSAFVAAPYVGAFKDAGDNWMSGAWVDWSNGS
jgi:hypothetical protein